MNMLDEDLGGWNPPWISSNKRTHHTDVSRCCFFCFFVRGAIFLHKFLATQHKNTWIFVIGNDGSVVSKFTGKSNKIKDTITFNKHLSHPSPHQKNQPERTQQKYPAMFQKHKTNVESYDNSPMIFLSDPFWLPMEVPWVEMVRRPYMLRLCMDIPRSSRPLLTKKKKAMHDEIHKKLRANLFFCFLFGGGW